MPHGDLESMDWASTDQLEAELQELIDEAQRRKIWHRLDLAAIAVVLVLVALSVYVIAAGG